MPGFMKSASSFFGLSDPVDDEEEFEEDIDVEESSFDSDRSVTPIPMSTPTATSSKREVANPFANKVSRITTIHPRSYDDAQQVGRAVRDGIPVVLNLTDVSEAVAYRIVDFSSGVVFGVRGSIERVTPRVFLLSPAQVSIETEESTSRSKDLFTD